MLHYKQWLKIKLPTQMEWLWNLSYACGLSLRYESKDDAIVNMSVFL